MSCLFPKWAPLHPPVPVSKPRCSTGLPLYTAMLLIGSQIDGTKEMAFRFHFHIVAQYTVKTKFDDALKILVAHEKMAELSVANMQCVISSFFLFETVYIPLIDIYYQVFLQCWLPNTGLMTQFWKRGSQNIFQAVIGLFRGSGGMSPKI